MSEDWSNTQISDLQDLLASVLRDVTNGGVAHVVRYVLVVDVIDSDGERQLPILYPRTVEDWETIGLLEAASDKVRYSHPREDT